MTSGLSIGSPSVDKGAPEITPQQERALEVEQKSANLGNIEQKVDVQLASNDVFAQYPEDAKGIVKNALMEACYVRFGNDPNITNVGAYFNANKQEHSIEVTVDQFLSVSLNPEKVLENYKLSHPEFDLEGAKLKFSELGHDIEVGKVFSSLMKEVNSLKNAVEKATDNRQNFMNQRAEEIANTGPLKRLFGGAPPPIPDIDKVPLTREEITKYIPPELLASDSLQRLLTAQQSNTTIVLGENDGVLKEVVNSTLGLGEATAVTVHNAAWDMTAAAGALGYGLLQFTKDASIEDATRVAKERYKQFSGQSHHEMSANAKKTVDENYVLQGAGYALGKTVVPVVEALNDTLPEPVTVFGGLVLSSIPSGKSLVLKNSVPQSVLKNNISQSILKHADLGDFNTKNRLVGGGHGQTNIEYLKANGIAFNVEKEYANGVRVGNIPDHKHASKRQGIGQSWFPENWDANKIGDAGNHVKNLPENINKPDGQWMFGEYEGVRVGIIKNQGEVGTIIPDNMKQP